MSRYVPAEGGGGGGGGGEEERVRGFTLTSA